MFFARQDPRAAVASRHRMAVEKVNFIWKYPSHRLWLKGVRESHTEKDDDNHSKDISIRYWITFILAKDDLGHCFISFSVCLRSLVPLLWSNARLLFQDDTDDHNLIALDLDIHFLLISYTYTLITWFCFTFATSSPSSYYSTPTDPVRQQLIEHSPQNYPKFPGNFATIEI